MAKTSAITEITPGIPMRLLNIDNIDLQPPYTGRRPATDTAPANPARPSPRSHVAHSPAPALAGRLPRLEYLFVLVKYPAGTSISCGHLGIPRGGHSYNYLTSLRASNSEVEVF